MSRFIIIIKKEVMHQGEEEEKCERTNRSPLNHLADKPIDKTADELL